MKFPFCILLLLFGNLFLLPTGPLWACSAPGGSQEMAPTATAGEHCTAVVDGCETSHPGQECPPDTDDCGHCHCPGCGASGAGSGGFFKNFSFHLDALAGLYADDAANFCYRAPSTSAHLAVLLRPPIAVQLV